MPVDTQWAASKHDKHPYDMPYLEHRVQDVRPRRDEDRQRDLQRRAGVEQHDDGGEEQLAHQLLCFPELRVLAVDEVQEAVLAADGGDGGVAGVAEQ